MLVRLNKKQVAQRFANADHTYTQHAVVQQRMSDELCQIMLHYCPSYLHHIFEIGCGSGNLSKKVYANFEVQQFYLNDLYSKVQQHFPCDMPIKWMIGDIEHLELPTQLDAIISSSAIQWINDLQGLCHRISIALKKQGWLCFSTFGPNNFSEIKQLTGQGLEYWSLQEWRKCLIESQFEIIELKEQSVQLYFNSSLEVLKHLKATGVTGTSNQKQRWTRKTLQAFDLNYQALMMNQEQYQLTYHPIYCIARK